MRLVKQPSLRRFAIFYDHLSAAKRPKIELDVNSPTFLGFSILDITKILKQDFLYGYLGETYPEEKSEFLYTDIASLPFSLKQKIFEALCCITKILLNFSGYAPE